MPHVYRLSRHDFDTLLIQGRTRGRLFSVAMGSISGRGIPGGACIISKKVAREAVVRNGVKRKVRQALAPLLSTMTTPSVFVCTAHREAAHASFEEIQSEISRLVQELRTRHYD